MRDIVAVTLRVTSPGLITPRMTSPGLVGAHHAERDGYFQTKRPVRSLRPSKPLTGPAPPRRSVCAPGTMVFPLYRRPVLSRSLCYASVILAAIRMFSPRAVRRGEWTTYHTAPEAGPACPVERRTAGGPDRPQHLHGPQPRRQRPRIPATGDPRRQRPTRRRPDPLRPCGP